MFRLEVRLSCNPQLHAHCTASGGIHLDGSNCCTQHFHGALVRSQVTRSQMERPRPRNHWCPVYSGAPTGMKTSIFGLPHSVVRGSAGNLVMPMPIARSIAVVALGASNGLQSTSQFIRRFKFECDLKIVATACKW